MHSTLDQFDANMERARGLLGVARSLGALTTSAVDTSDVLRAALVHGVSALDHFVHEFVRAGMLRVHRGEMPATEAHLSFRIPLSAARAALADTSNYDWLDQAVREAHGWHTFQHPDKIADAVRLVSGVRLWECVGSQLGLSAKACRTELMAIIDRRNKIAHEADMDPTNPGAKWPIDPSLVAGALDFLGRVARAIVTVAA